MDWASVHHRTVRRTEMETAREDFKTLKTEDEIQLKQLSQSKIREIC